MNQKEKESNTITETKNQNEIKTETETKNQNEIKKLVVYSLRTKEEKTIQVGTPIIVVENRGFELKLALEEWFPIKCLMCKTVTAQYEDEEGWLLCEDCLCK